MATSLKSYLTSTVLVLFVSLLPSAGGAAVWHVNTTAGPSPADGLTWATSFTNVQIAINSANTGHDIEVYEGL